MTELEILDCFQRQANGMWACVKPVSINSPNGSVQIGPGMSFGPGVQFMGVDLFTILNGLAAKYGR